MLMHKTRNFYYFILKSCLYTSFYFIFFSFFEIRKKSSYLLTISGYSGTAGLFVKCLNYVCWFLSSFDALCEHCSNKTKLKFLSQCYKTTFTTFLNIYLLHYRKNYKRKQPTGDAIWGKPTGEKQDIKFSTRDRDNDNNLILGCSSLHGQNGGNWYPFCSPKKGIHQNLNGEYPSCFGWKSLEGEGLDCTSDGGKLKSSKMMVRPKKLIDLKILSRDLVGTNRDIKGWELVCFIIKL